MATMKLDIGGAETHIVELSKALKRRGIDVYVASNGGAYEAELKEADIPHFTVELHSKSPACMKRAYTKLKRIIVDNKIDVVHAHARIPGFLCGKLQKKLKFPFVTTAHWVFNTRFPLNLLTDWGQRSLAVSDDIKKYLVDNYSSDPDNIRVTINGIDTEKFSPSIDYSSVAKEFSLKDDKYRIVYISRMDEDRSFAAHKLIEITERLASKIPNLEAVIVGGGNDYENIKAKAEAVNQKLKRKAVILTGSRTDINKFIVSGNIFIGVSRAALEAMACSRPCIIAGNEGYIGIFDEDKLKVSIDTNFCCRGCRQTTAEELYKDIMTLFENKDNLCERLGEYSRDTVKKYYSVETMADDALKMYISVIKDSKINEVKLDELSDIEKYLNTSYDIGKKRDIDIMISGYYGFKNSGDDSILKAMLMSLRKLKPDIRIVVLSKNPEETGKNYNVETIDRFDFIKIYRYMGRTKLLISGGGSLIQDITSNKSLMYYLGIIRAAKTRGAKVMLYANGIGPVKNVSNHRHIRRVLNETDLITLREQSSLDELKILGVDKPETYVTADPAFTLETADEAAMNEVFEECGLKKNEKYFIISLRAWDRLDENFEKYISEFADYIYDRYGFKPVLLPMQLKYDTDICLRTAKLIKCDNITIGKQYTPSKLLGIIENAEFVLGMRLHTLIYAARVKTAVIGLVYDPKVRAMMDYMGQNYVLDVENMNFEKLKEYADSIIENKDNIAQELNDMSLKAEIKAEENAELAIKLLDF